MHRLYSASQTTSEHIIVSSEVDSIARLALYLVGNVLMNQFASRCATRAIECPLRLLPPHACMSPVSPSEARPIHVALHRCAWLAVGCRPELSDWVGVIMCLTFTVHARRR